MSGADRPLCRCHGAPMQARGGTRRTPWRCAVTQRRLDAEYRARGGWWTSMRRRDRIAAAERRHQLKELNGEAD